MNKNADISDILQNCSYAIDTKKNIEFLIDFPIKIDQKNMEFYYDSNFKITSKILGSFLADFLNTNFENYDEFSLFFSNYCPMLIDKNRINKDYKVTDDYNIYRSVVTQVQNKNKSYYLELQKQLDMILDYCLINPTKDALPFSPIERMYVLERISPALTLLNNNKLEFYRITTFSSNPGNTEKEIYNFLSKKKNRIDESNILIPKNLSEVLYFSLYNILKNEIHLKVCKNCDNFFVTKNQLTNYCDRVAPDYSKKTCKDIGRTAVFNKNKADDPILDYYHKVYNKKSMMKSRNPDISQYGKDFEKFKQIGKKKREKYIKKLITEEEFEKWIRKND